MDSGLYQDKYRVASTRWHGYDYSQNGAYFVTICTQNRRRYFGEICARQVVGAEAVLASTPLVERAVACWQEIPGHFPFAVPDAFMVMPDHVHGIIFFHKPDTNTEAPARFGPQSQNLAAVVRGFKVGVKAWATRTGVEFMWQQGYFDRVIRNETELQKAREYIRNNPSQWSADHEKTDGLFR